MVHASCIQKNKASSSLYLLLPSHTPYCLPIPSWKIFHDTVSSNSKGKQPNIVINYIKQNVCRVNAFM